MAKEAGANCIVTACPLCMANLDMRADAACKMPVFYFTELLALAMGLPGPDKWFKTAHYRPDAARTVAETDVRMETRSPTAGD